MQIKNSTHQFNTLRKKHSYFIYEGLTIKTHQKLLEIRYHFNLSDSVSFTPTLSIPIASFHIQDINETELQNLAFHIGLVELISYWKAACPPKLIIRAGFLDAGQINWWKKLWFNGLGEFFYTNGIQVGMDDFIEVVCEEKSKPESFNFETNNKVLVPVGGGKDSVVTLELLKRAGLEVVPFVLNARNASVESAVSAGFERSDIFKINRTIDPALLDLNKKGYLNGHTPFSALLAFVTLLAARIDGIGHIALSNESSANEATIPGTQVNHQYSKSFEFEKDFRDYVAKYISPDFNYFSFLRPLNELQIAKLFSGFNHHFSTFKSCNVGSKTDTWCGTCPKCLFTWIILSPFIEQEKLTSIFGKNLFEDNSLIHTLEELTGMVNEKPFECVGTVDEVNAAIQYTIKRRIGNKMPALLEYYISKSNYPTTSAMQLVNQYDEANFLNPDFDHILKKGLL